MSAPHTPGPWSAFTDDSGERPHTNIVAVVPRTACVFALPGHHKNEANVRLIAAAPDLLEALLAQDEVRKIGLLNMTDEQIFRVDALRAAAIRKAVGA